MKRKLFTSESVTSGHPDKICDFIADSILDEALRQDPFSHMAVEATIKDDFILIYGEANTKASIPYEQIAKDCLKKIGYKEEYHVMTKVSKQSREIDDAVSHEDISAGDQGIMFGYADDETESYMPLAIYYAHKLASELERYRRKDDRLLPDGKTQVTVEYVDGVAERIDTVLISCQHIPSLTQEKLHNLLMEHVVRKVIDPKYLDENTKYLINPSGSFTVGGSFGDSGTTGRKIVVDSYGGYAPIGGGCFSSKDPTKVDRSAAYYARYVCKNLVANGYAHKCQIEVSYAIGKPQPINICIDTFNTSSYTEEQLLAIIENNFDFSVKNIIDELNLRQPIYANSVNYGHFGREGLPWEKVIKL